MYNTNILPPHLMIKDGIHGLGVFATSEIKKGMTLYILHGPVTKIPSRTSVQIGPNQHIEDIIGAFINHSCSPNVAVITDKKTQAFICLQDIQAGDEITFNYQENEDELASPFTCRCCGKKIVGKKVVASVS